MIPGELLRWQTEHDITHNGKQTAFNLSGWRIGGNWWTKHFLHCSCLSLTGFSRRSSSGCGTGLQSSAGARRYCWVSCPQNCWSSQSCFYHQGSAQQVSVQGKLSQSPQWAVGTTTSRQDRAGAAKSSRVLLPSFFLSMLASLCHHKLPSGWSQTTEAIKFLPFYCCEPGVQLHCQQAFITVSSFTAHVHVWRTEGFNLHLAFSAHIKYLSVY